MRAELANANHCALPFLSRAVANLCWYYYTSGKIRNRHTTTKFRYCFLCCEMELRNLQLKLTRLKCPCQPQMFIFKFTGFSHAISFSPSLSFSFLSHSLSPFLSIYPNSSIFSLSASFKFNRYIRPSPT